MLEMEENEIAILKSRGAGRMQIIRLYFFQSLFLSLISFIIGLPLGKLICKMLGTSSAFLEFSAGRSLSVRYSGEALLYGFAAVMISTFMTLLPVLKKSTSSIVSVKRKRSRQAKPLWQKLFLDVIMLGVSIYGYYSFSSRQDELLVQVLSGESLDPIIFLSSSLFILGAGLFSLRIHSFLILVLFKLGKSRWQPASYKEYSCYAMVRGQRLELNYVPYTKNELKVIVNNGISPATKFEIKDLKDEEIYVGDYASVIEVKSFKADVLAIPQNAVYSDATGEFVYEIKDGERIRRSVILGISDNANVEVVEGLEEGACIYVKS